MANGFRLQSRNIFLTYPKCTSNKELLAEWFKSEFNSVYVLISHEYHADGSDHLHALVQFPKKLNTTNERMFDFEGNHPNIQSPRNLPATKTYIKKDGDFIEWQKEEDDNTENLYDIARTNEHEQFFEYCRLHKIQFQYANLAWITTHQVDTTIKPQDKIQGTYDQKLQWYQAPIPLRTTIVVGPSGIGKTVWVKERATKPALFVTHLDDLKCFRPNYHKSIIFDDMSFSHMPITAQIHLLDTFEPRSIHVRYGTVKLPAGIEKWITCNDTPVSEHEALRRRTNLINLY